MQLDIRNQMKHENRKKAIGYVLMGLEIDRLHKVKEKIHRAYME